MGLMTTSVDGCGVRRGDGFPAKTIHTCNFFFVRLVDPTSTTPVLDRGT